MKTERGREGVADRQTDRQTDRQRQREGEREGVVEGKREREGERGSVVCRLLSMPAICKAHHKDGSKAPVALATLALDGSVQTIVRGAAALRWMLQIKLSISPSQHAETAAPALP